MVWGVGSIACHNPHRLTHWVTLSIKKFESIDVETDTVWWRSIHSYPALNSPYVPTLLLLLLLVVLQPTHTLLPFVRLSCV